MDLNEKTLWLSRDETEPNYIYFWTHKPVLETEFGQQFYEGDDNTTLLGYLPQHYLDVLFNIVLPLNSVKQIRVSVI